MAAGMFSIIIATHNDGVFLSECMDSVLQQTYTNFELIIVNDGSTDDTVKICESYQKKDCRVHVINQECRGALYARQRGLQEAVGDYIYVIDGDDLIDRRTLETVERYLNLNQVDMVVFAAETFGGRGEQIAPLPFLHEQIVETGELIDGVLVAKNHALWNKIFRRNVFVCENDCFQRFNCVRVGLDKIQLFSTLPNVKKAIYINQIYYHYRIREQSISHKIRPLAAYEIGVASEYVYFVLKDKGLLTESRKKICCVNYLEGFIQRLISLLRSDIPQKEYCVLRDKIKTSIIYQVAYDYVNRENLDWYYVMYAKLFRYTATEKCLRIYCRARGV